MHRVVFSLLLIALAGCQTLPQHRVHQRALADESVLKAGATTLILPMHVEVKEMSVSGVSEVVPEWSDTAKAKILAYLKSHADSLMAPNNLVEMPELSEQQMDVLKEHINLTKEIWATAQVFPMYGGPTWVERMKRFDYSIGPGLAFLAESAGARQALLIIGEDVHTTSGRKAFSFVAAAFGVAVPLGYKVMGAALVDLESGDILWTNTKIDAASGSLLKTEDIAASMQTMFEAYPDIEAYRKFSGPDSTGSL